MTFETITTFLLPYIPINLPAIKDPIATPRIDKEDNYIFNAYNIADSLILPILKS